MDLSKIWKKNKFNVIINKGIVLFPKITVSLKINKEQFTNAAKQAIEDDKPIVVVTQKNNNNQPQEKDIYSIGVLCKVLELKGNDRTSYEVVVEAIDKVKITSLDISKSMIVCYADKLEDIQSKDLTKTNLLFTSLKEKIYELYSTLSINFYEISQLEEVKSPSLFTSYVGMSGFLKTSERQMILEELNVNTRIEKLMSIINKILEEVNIQKDINKKINQKFTKSQREAFLRQQLEEIKKELGDSDNNSKDESSFIKKVSKSDMPPHVKEVAQEELRKLETVSPNSSEYNVIRNYLEWLVSMPWNKSSKDEIDIANVRKQLDLDHYALEKVKKRILEYLAVNKLRNGNLNGPIICLVGPPGIGKTSLGHSIAKSIGREFIRASLGGVKDESEIRGHRRTYIGAMPGKIIQSLKRVQSNNPVLLLDEIDKLTASYNGDPSSALLEVLDPEQNNSFTDHYLDVPFDLSKIMFIATANNVENIPPALKDRMEVIYISGYTSVEKYHIAKNYLIPKVMSDNGVTDLMIEIDDLSIIKIISSYTRESGVRELKRHLSTLCRSAAINWVEKNKKIVVNEKELHKILGSELYEREVIQEKMEPGVVNGLAWTPVGGDLLFIETSLFDQGSGRIQLTGQLGSVMKESALIALSYIKSNYDFFKIDANKFKTNDFHIHVPSGAIKKDGPSAGITIFSSMVSILLNKKVSNLTAMTGEITLKGQVTAVGGIKEKIIAAHTAGVKEVVLSIQNKKDVEEVVPDEVKKDLKFIYVSDLKEVYEKLFQDSSEQPTTNP